jgi:hypothetical protein
VDSPPSPESLRRRARGRHSGAGTGPWYARVGKMLNGWSKVEQVMVCEWWSEVVLRLWGGCA